MQTNRLATEEMTACPSCGDLTFNAGPCCRCTAKSKMLLDTKPFDLPTAFDKGYEAALLTPIDMLIFCPNCGKQHIDRPDSCGNCGSDDRHLRLTAVFEGVSQPCRGDFHYREQWRNPPHKSHSCREEDGGCGIIWRPADVPTNGVASIQTRGKADTWPRDPAAGAAAEIPRPEQPDDWRKDLNQIARAAAA